MVRDLAEIRKDLYDKCALRISNFRMELESKEYGACRFQLNGRTIIHRNAKITPRKVGQFVTFWKRNGTGPIEPFDESDLVDLYVVNVRTESRSGQFVFPRSVLIAKGILTTVCKEGKRAFRVYPNWDTVTNAQAARTQHWQLNYFYEINDSLDLNNVAELYIGE